MVDLAWNMLYTLFKVRCNMKRKKMAAHTDRYKSFAELRSSEPEKLAYRFQVVKRHTGLAIIAPHGGGIEPGTSEIARAIASNRFSFYAFEGLKKEGNEVLHITSALFDEPGCLRLLNDSDFAVALKRVEDFGCRTGLVSLITKAIRRKNGERNRRPRTETTKSTKRIEFYRL